MNYTDTLFSAALALAAPLIGGVLVGLDRKLTARMQERVGPPLAQPFYDVLKLWGKGELLYYPGGVSEKEILIPYGSTCFASKVGQLPGSHFATIVEGAERLAEMGEKVLWEGAQEISIESGDA